MKRSHEHAESCEYIHVHEDIVEKVNDRMPAEDDLDDLADFFKISEILPGLRYCTYCFVRRCASVIWRRY